LDIAGRGEPGSQPPGSKQKPLRAVVSGDRVRQDGSFLSIQQGRGMPNNPLIMAKTGLSRYEIG